MNDLLLNIDKIHTTELGKERIIKNLNLCIPLENAVDFCISKIKDSKCKITRLGKNWYCKIDNIIITINAYSYTIITAHISLFNI